MAYTELPILASGSDISAANWNLWIHDNFELSPAALATTKGDMVVATASGISARFGVGTNGQIVESDDSLSTGLKNSWAFIPVGGIILWAGTIISLPSNWELCDGNNGTPNLTDRFIIGAGGSYSVGATGGADTVNLAHTHGSFSTASAGIHSHTVGNTNAGSAHTHSKTTNATSSFVGYRYEVSSPVASNTPSHTHTFTTVSESSHTHVNPDTENDTGHSHTLTLSSELSSSQDIRPPYYALAYIMRTS